MSQNCFEEDKNRTFFRFFGQIHLYFNCIYFYIQLWVSILWKIFFVFPLHLYIVWKQAILRSFGNQSVRSDKMIFSHPFPALKSLPMKKNKLRTAAFHLKFSRHGIESKDKKKEGLQGTFSRKNMSLCSSVSKKGDI